MATTTLPDPVFITSDPDEIVQGLITFYQTETGLTLSAAQVERLLINAWAYREALTRSGVNEAAKLNLLAFATGVILDYIAQLVGSTRLPSTPALTTIECVLVTGHGGVIIPQGTRIASTDGKAVFRIINPTPVDAGVDVIDVPCQCDTPGVIGNNYTAGLVSVIQDPQAYLASAGNIDTTSGGAEVESDEQFRIRIQLAPASFGTAGAEDAYKYWARTANQSIVDVEVENGGPGVVNVYPLIGLPGGTPQPILDQVDATLSPKNRRPLNDEVKVISPTDVPYDIDLGVILFDTADATLALQNIQAAVQAYATSRRNKLGLDAIIDQIKGVTVLPGIVYSIAVNQPVADVVVSKSEYADYGTINVTISGVNNG